MDSYYWNLLFRATFNGSVVLIVFILLLLALRPVLDKRVNSHFRVKLWWILLFVPILSMNSFFINARSDYAPLHISLPASELVWTEQSPLHATAADATDAKAAEPVRRISLVSVTAYVWLSGAIGLGVYFAGGELLFRRRVRRWSLPMESEALWNVVRRVQDEIDNDDPDHYPAYVYSSRLLGKKIRVLVSPRVSGPMMSGFFKPTLLLPHENYPPEEFYYICRHELTHFQEDHVSFRALALYFNAVHWFNPLVWILRRELYRSMELCCDDVALQNAKPEEKRRYCQLLLATVPQQRGDSSACTTYFRGNQRLLKDRIQNVFHTGPRCGAWMAVVLFAIGIYVCGGLLLSTQMQALPVAQNLSQPEGYRAERQTYVYHWAASWLKNLTKLPEDDPHRILSYEISSIDFYRGEDKDVTYLDAYYTIRPVGDPAESPFWRGPKYFINGNIGMRTVFRLQNQDVWLVCTDHVVTSSHAQVEAAFPDLIWR